MKVIVTTGGDQAIINDTATTYTADTLADWIDQARRALVGDADVELIADTELATDDPEGDDDAEDIGFRGGH